MIATRSHTVTLQKTCIKKNDPFPLGEWLQSEASFRGIQYIFSPHPTAKATKKQSSLINPEHLCSVKGLYWVTEPGWLQTWSTAKSVPTLRDCLNANKLNQTKFPNSWAKLQMQTRLKTPNQIENNEMSAFMLIKITDHFLELEEET